MRGVSSNFQTAIAQGTVRPRLFVEIQTVNGYLRYWSGGYAVNWNGYTWNRADILKGIGIVQESIDKDNQLQIVLAGESSVILSTILGGMRQYATLKIWFGLLAADYSIISDPYLIFLGKLSTCEIEDGVKEATVTLGYESSLVSMIEPKELLYTHAAQQMIYPGDNAFMYVEQLQAGFSGYWGRTKKAETKRSNSAKQKIFKGAGKPTKPK